jgi:hypothetical protein
MAEFAKSCNHGKLTTSDRLPLLPVLAAPLSLSKSRTTRSKPSLASANLMSSAPFGPGWNG